MSRLSSACVSLAWMVAACTDARTAPPPASAPRIVVPAPAPAPPAGAPEIAEIHKARCGTCHVRVEPGARTREVLTAAFVRHRNRLRLREEQWSALIDYLAAHSS